MSILGNGSRTIKSEALPQISGKIIIKVSGYAWVCLIDNLNLSLKPRNSTFRGFTNHIKAQKQHFLRF